MIKELEKFFEVCEDVFYLIFSVVEGFVNEVECVFSLDIVKVKEKVDFVEKVMEFVDCVEYILMMECCRLVIEV